MEEPKFKIETFEGPLDLLLSLITKNKVDIYDIPIALILDQYMEYLEQMKMLDMDIAGEFIVMAAELMLIKSRMLLPKPPKEEEEDPRDALARALVEYKRAKEAAMYLSGQYEKYAGRMIKDTDVIDTGSEPPVGLDAEILKNAFDRLLKRNRDIPALARESERTIGNLLTHRIVPVSEKIYAVMKALFRRGDMSFDDVMLTAASRSELIATFVAVLELVRVQRVELIDSDPENIMLHLNRTHKREVAHV